MKQLLNGFCYQMHKAFFNVIFTLFPLNVEDPAHFGHWIMNWHNIGITGKLLQQSSVGLVSRMTWWSVFPWRRSSSCQNAWMSCMHSLLKNPLVRTKRWFLSDFRLSTAGEDKWHMRRHMALLTVCEEVHRLSEQLNQLFRITQPIQDYKLVSLELTLPFHSALLSPIFRHGNCLSSGHMVPILILWWLQSLMWRLGLCAVYFCSHSSLPGTWHIVGFIEILMSEWVTLIPARMNILS